MKKSTGPMSLGRTHGIMVCVTKCHCVLILHIFSCQAYPAFGKATVSCAETQESRQRDGAMRRDLLTSWREAAPLVPKCGRSRSRALHMSRKVLESYFIDSVDGGNMREFEFNMRKSGFLFAIIARMYLPNLARF